MRISNVEYLLRKNKGNYEHEEVKLSAVVDEGECYASVLAAVKSMAYEALYTDTVSSEPKDSTPVAQVVEEEVKAEETPEATPPKDEKKEKKERKSKATDKNSAFEIYDRTNSGHTSALAGYLTKTYGEAWKSKPNLKTFSESLNGKEFRVKTTGLLTDPFKAELEAFFGSSENGL